jgi:hypothetical protein
MYHVRLMSRCADPMLLAHMEAAVIERVGDVYIYAAAHIGRSSGWASAQVFEFDCTSPAVATDVAEEVCRIGQLESVRLTIDGRSLDVVGTGAPGAPADEMDHRYRAIDLQ